MSDKRVNELQRKIYKENMDLAKQITKTIDVIEHAKLVRKELQKNFPYLKFKVVSDRFSGGNSVTVYHKGSITEEQGKLIYEFVDQFCGYRSDLADGNYNVGFEYNGERISGATFCSYNGKDLN